MVDDMNRFPARLVRYRKAANDRIGVSAITKHEVRTQLADCVATHAPIIRFSEVIGGVAQGESGIAIRGSAS
jgi:hypothetical protein